jgi:hypothetical protein
MVKKTIKVPFKKVDWIVHTADIDFRTLKRHAVYEVVFDRFCKKIKK